MELGDFLSLVRLISETLIPFKGMTGNSDCDECKTGNIVATFKILETLDNCDFIIYKKKR